MIVSELLSLPLFSNFISLNKSNGMNNEILGTSIFDWETREDVEKTFGKGDFVLTTLARLKTDQNLDTTLDAIFSIFDKGVAAVAIKKAFDFSLPKEVLEYANSKSIPIFVFENTYIDDIIYVVKNILINDSLNSINFNKLKSIMKLNDANLISKVFSSINKYFYTNYIVCACIPKKKLTENELAKHFVSFRKTLSAILEKTDAAYTVITGKKTLFIILSFADDTDITAQVTAALQPFACKNHFSIGISNICDKTENFKLTLMEGIFASLIGILNDSTLEEFDNLKSDQLFYPKVFSNRGKTFYDNINDTFNKHDIEHSSDFKRTLLTYIKNNGNINETSVSLYQHPNTVRYRIKKIKELLEVEDSYESSSILYAYSRLDSIYSIMTKCELPIMQD